MFSKCENKQITVMAFKNYFLFLLLLAFVICFGGCYGQGTWRCLFTVCPRQVRRRVFIPVNNVVMPVLTFSHFVKNFKSLFSKPSLILLFNMSSTCYKTGA